MVRKTRAIGFVERCVDVPGKFASTGTRLNIWCQSLKSSSFLAIVSVAFLPSLSEACLPATSGQVLCWAKEVILAKVIDAPRKDTCESSEDCNLRPAAVKVKVVKALAISQEAPHFGIPATGSTLQLIVNLATPGFPSLQGSVYAPYGRIRESILNKEFILGFDPAEEDAFEPRSASIWWKESEVWVKKAISSGADCPTPIWNLHNRKYPNDSDGIVELTAYAKSVVIARLDHPSQGRSALSGASVEGLTRRWAVAASAQLSDNEIDQLLAYFRSRQGKRFVDMQTRLQPIVTRADAEVLVRNPPMSRDESNEPRPPSWVRHLVKLALSQQSNLWGPTEFNTNVGVLDDPFVVDRARVEQGGELERINRLFQNDLNSFWHFRRSEVMQAFLESLHSAYLQCEMGSSC